MSKGRLIILEGGDGSGKATQTLLLDKRLRQEGHTVKSISFPDYDSPSSALVKMYLHGDFGKSAEAVNPYVASTFYATDRFASYQLKWKDFLESGGIVLADRYTTSNMVHQMVKYNEPEKRQMFLDWLWDFEFVKFGLPVPQLVCLLDVPLAVSEKLMADRQAKTGGQTGDIHENDRQYLAKCHNAYAELVTKYGWQRVACADGMTMKSPLEIHERIYALVEPLVTDKPILK
jgi:dTMP kinase